ncbi:hypothetical protein [uncultured Adlercreutzia sp.]|uniref:hypothetical protein n=1 Tax=uncultured Adlercreutzia sp. TaxID=875803 RepID=UPI0026769382|nr:hypothetical protein [uncultured Adlercreutzia sp.]
MKICPTCMSKLFDDMDTCYGCMYRFGSDPEREREAEAVMWPPTPEDVNEGAALEGSIPWGIPEPAGLGCGGHPPSKVSAAHAMEAGGLVLRVIAGSGRPEEPLVTITIEPA